MNKNLQKPEVLSPAGNRESFFAAINNGADAVYLGLKDFNARNNIQNFSFEGLKEVLDYAHLFGVKVYLTFNILIKNFEMEDAIKTIKTAYMLGIDAIIVQDLGLAMQIKKCFPDLPLHASTQMGIHNLEGAKFLEGLGFSRVVLSRETPLDEIKRIHENTNLEIEYFVQGALCVAFSGNCYLCSLLSGNSGNRGKCQQFCRLPYKLSGKNVEKEGFMLSAKDFCMLPALKDLFDAGVISFKIEGRARRSAYVAGSTAVYRKAVDNNFKYNGADIEELKKLFNRGDYTKGYFEDSKILYSKIQGHIGVKIGKLTKISLGKRFNILEIESKKEIHKGDGLKFIKNESELGSIGVQDVKKQGNNYVITTTAKIEKGADVYLTLDALNEEKLLENVRKLKISGSFIAKINKKAVLTLNCNGISVKVESENPFEEAKNQRLTEEDVYSQLSKLGDEPFELEKLDCDLENVFARKSELNDLRRKAVLKLKEEILKSNQKQRICCDFEQICEKSNGKNDKKIISIADLESKEKIKDYKNTLLVYSPNNYVLSDIKKFDEFCKEKKVCGYLNLPIFATEKDLNFIRTITEQTDLGVVANNYYALTLLPAEKVVIGMGLNVYNNYSVDVYKSFGFNKIVLSRELSLLELENFGLSANLFAFARGREEYMTLKSCPFKEHIGGSCKDCRYFDGLIYKMQNGKEMIIERKKMMNCQFVLKSKNFKENDVFLTGKYVEIE